MKFKMMLLFALTFPCISIAEPLFFDGFSRPDSGNLGAPWVKGNETTMDYVTSSAMKVGTTLLRVRLGRMEFNYKTHPSRSGDVYNSSNARPFAIGALTRGVKYFPIRLRFNFRPNQDERMAHDVGLMSLRQGGSQEGGPPFFAPYSGIGITIERGSRAYFSSALSIMRYTPIGRKLLSQKLIAFQYDFGKTYRVTMTINSDYSALAEVSDGTQSDSVSSGPATVRGPLDALFVSDIQGGLSFDTPELIGTFPISFDTFWVYEVQTQYDGTPRHRVSLEPIVGPCG